MLKLFRRKESLKKFFLGFILVFISAALVISLAPLPSATTGATQGGTLAEYKGEEVTVLHLQRALDAQFRGSPLGREPAIRAQFAPRVLDELLFRYVGIDEARRLGLTVSNEELTAYLRTLPWLYPEGNFVGMDRYELIIQSQSRMTVAEFEAQMRESLLLDKLRWVASDGLEVSDAEVREEFHRRSDQVQIDYVLFDPSRYLQAVEIEAAQLEAYFAANQGTYSVAEQRRLSYVLIEPARVRAAAEVSEEEIRAYYRSRLDEFRVQERAQVSHILFRTLGQSEEEAALAEQKANDVLKQARAGSEFAKLAEEHSEDATAAVGGDLGWVYRGQTVSEFERAAFSLEPNTISDLIKTTYGFHILKVADRQKAHLETFDQVQDRLRPILESQKRDAALGALANRVERALRARPTAFSEVAAELDLKVRETPLFRQGQAVTDLGTENNVHDLAFRLREGEVGPAVSVPKGRVIIQLIERVEEHLPTLDQVRGRVEQDYRA
ncbi:MAG: peptidylprolyl isomerase, partial [Acidobacteriota bacterium]